MGSLAPISVQGQTDDEELGPLLGRNACHNLCVFSDRPGSAECDQRRSRTALHVAECDAYAPLAQVDAQDTAHAPKGSTVGMRSAHVVRAAHGVVVGLARIEGVTTGVGVGPGDVGVAGGLPVAVAVPVG